MKLKIYAPDPGCLPEAYHPGDAGLDLRSRYNTFLKYNTPEKVETGIHIEIPEGYVGLIYSRSGLSFKYGVKLVNSVGVIDSGYRGQIMCPMIFTGIGMNSYHIKQYARIAQLVIMPISTPVLEVVHNLEDLEDSVRGTDGFGSTDSG